ncbi:MAG: alkaline phosphatase family protein [Clostridia bacterium]|nr:alkaline phosphatase family protein [Clostridia bacterium]
MKTYKYAAVIGIDGMGNFNFQTETPNLDRIFEHGAVNGSAISQNPTISAQNWGAMLLGATPLVHKLTNGIVSNEHYTNDALPSVFKIIRESDPDCYLASVCNWNPINHGIVEEGLGVEKLTASNDKELTPLIIECVKKKPKFLFVQLDDVDGAGHSGGYGTEHHLEEIRRADGYTGEIYNAYREAGILDDTLFIVIADHGGVRNGHGGYTDTEKYVYMGISGEGVKEGIIPYSETRDIAAIVLYALGLPVPEYNEQGFTSQIPENIWEGTKPYYRKPAEKTVIPVRETPQNIYDFIPEDKIKLLMHLDNSLEDRTEKCTFEEKGTVKFHSNGVNGGCGEFGKTGFAMTEDVHFGEENFSIAFWVETDSSITEAPALMGNQDWWWQSRKNKGLTVALRCNDVMFNISNGNDHLDTVVPFPQEAEDGWMHYIAAFDREENEVRFYNNFKLRHKITIPDGYLISYDTDYPFVIGNDGKGIYNNVSHDFIFRLDDVLITAFAFNDESTESLRKYYYGE